MVVYACIFLRRRTGFGGFKRKLSSVLTLGSYPGPDRVNNQHIEKEIICKEEAKFCFNVAI